MGKVLINLMLIVPLIPIEVVIPLDLYISLVLNLTGIETGIIEEILLKTGRFGPPTRKIHQINIPTKIIEPLEPIQDQELRITPIIHKISKNFQKTPPAELGRGTVPLKTSDPKFSQIYQNKYSMSK